MIKKKEERNLDTSSDDDDVDHPLNFPKMIVFLQLLYAHGPYYFDSIRNWDKEKNKLLEMYGYSLEDDLKGKFEFTYKDGIPFLRVLDPTIKRITPQESLKKERFAAVETETVVMESDANEKIERAGQTLGVVFNFNQDAYPGFLIEAVAGESNEDQTAFAGKVEKLDL